MSRIEYYSQKPIPKKAIIFGFIISALLISTSLFFLLYPFPSKEKVPYLEMEHPIVFNGEVYEKEALIKGGKVYLPLTFIVDQIDSTLIIDEKSESIILTTKDKVIQLPNEHLQYFVNKETMNLEIPVVKEENGEMYVSLTPLANVYPVNVSFVEESKIVLVEKNGDIKVPGTVNAMENEHLLKLRKDPDLTSPYVETLTHGETIFIESDESGFYYVRKQNGIAGFIKKEAITLAEPKVIQYEQEKVVMEKPQLTWPISLTWEAVYSKNPNTSKLPEMQGVNVVSPTWFSIKNDEGDIKNLASNDYVDWAKNRGYHVWALFSNEFNPERTHNVLKDFETREKLIRQLLQYSEMYELDGINVDFENVNYEDRHLVTQFMRELSPYLHQAGLIVSMDITFISGSENWSKFYEREKLAQIVDYLMVMAYDEHWATSPVSGSVASLPWVENNLNKLLEIVPNERLVLGVPFYTRIWKEQETENGNIEVSSKAYSMEQIQEWLQEHKLTPVFDEKTGQNYAEYYDEEEKAYYKTWIEDEVSMKQRVELVHKYKLAGVASWSRYFANDEIWSEIDEALLQLPTVEKKVKD